MEKFAQNYKGKKVYLIETVKTVDWLINNTEVQVFNPKDFSGYQGQCIWAWGSKLCQSFRRRALYIWLCSCNSRRGVGIN